VNESDAGVTIAYDEVNDRFKLSNDQTGDLDVSVSESAGGFLEALGLNSTSSLTRGSNAEFTLGGGGTIVASSNVLDESVHGIAGLSVTATSIGQETVTVASDTEGIDAGVRDFIKKYNAVQKFVDDRTKVTTNQDGSVTTAVFAGNREITDIARNLRTRVFDEVSGLSGTLKRLEGMGIDFEGNSSQLAVRDEAKFSAAISSNLDQVADIFTTASTGLSAKLDDYIDGLLAVGGSLKTQEATLEKKNSNLDKQIADIERRLAAERTRLEGSFIRMEEAQSQMNSQLASLQSILGLSN
jgi:flagellar hook-associated protein 2